MDKSIETMARINMVMGNFPVDLFLQKNFKDFSQGSFLDDPISSLWHFNRVLHNSTDLQMCHQKLFMLARHLSVGHFE